MRNFSIILTLIVSIGFAGETNGFAEIPFGTKKDSACKIMSPVQPDVSARAKLMNNPNPDSLKKAKSDSIWSKWMIQMEKYEVSGCDNYDEIDSQVNILWKFKGIEGPLRRIVVFNFTEQGEFYKYSIWFLNRDPIEKIKTLFSKKYGRSFKLKKKEVERDIFGMEIGYLYRYAITGPKTIVNLEVLVDVLHPEKSEGSVTVTSKKIQKKLDLIKRKKKNTGKDF